MSANAVREPVGPHDHRHGVPAHEALDPALDFLAARQRGLFFGTDRVDVGRDRAERERDALHAGVVTEGCQQPLHAAPVTLIDHVLERFEPFPLFERFELGAVNRRSIPHR